MVPESGRPSESRVLLSSKHVFTSNEQPASGTAMRDIEVKLDPRIAELSSPFVQRGAFNPAREPMKIIGKRR
jgi:hypothetical protein